MPTLYISREDMGLTFEGETVQEVLDLYTGWTVKDEVRASMSGAKLEEVSSAISAAQKAGENKIISDLAPGILRANRDAAEFDRMLAELQLKVHNKILRRHMPREEMRLMIHEFIEIKMHGIPGPGRVFERDGFRFTWGELVEHVCNLLLPIFNGEA